MLTPQTQNSFRAPKVIGTFEKQSQGPSVRIVFVLGQSTALYSLLSSCFKMESDRGKLSNYVHGYLSRVHAQCANTTPFFSDLP